MANGSRRGARIGKIVIVPRPRKARLIDVHPEHGWRSQLLVRWERGFDEKLCAAPSQRLDTDPPAVVQFVPDSR